MWERWARCLLTAAAASTAGQGCSVKRRTKPLSCPIKDSLFGHAAKRPVACPALPVPAVGGFRTPEPQAGSGGSSVPTCTQVKCLSSRGKCPFCPHRSGSTSGCRHLRGQVQLAGAQPAPQGCSLPPASPTPEQSPGPFGDLSTGKRWHRPCRALTGLQDSQGQVGAWPAPPVLSWAGLPAPMGTLQPLPCVPCGACGVAAAPLVSLGWGTTPWQGSTSRQGTTP